MAILISNVGAFFSRDKLTLTFNYTSAQDLMIGIRLFNSSGKIIAINGLTTLNVSLDENINFSTVTIDLSRALISDDQRLTTFNYGENVNLIIVDKSPDPSLRFEDAVVLSNLSLNSAPINPEVPASEITQPISPIQPTFPDVPMESMLEKKELPMGLILVVVALILLS